MTLFGAQKRFENHVSRMLSLNAWALSPQGLGCTPLDHCAHRDAGYARGARNVSPRPLNKPDDASGAWGIYLDGLTKDGLEPVPTRM
jgi:hypothetical protein